MTTKTELLEELRRLAEEQGPDITLFQFREQTGISRYKVYDRWGNWTTLRRAAGLPARVAARPVYSDDELWGEFHRAAKHLGHFPTCNEFSRLSERSWDTLDRRFGRKADVVDQYRGWLDQQPADARPEFLAGLAAEAEPSRIPGFEADLRFLDAYAAQEQEFLQQLDASSTWPPNIAAEVAKALALSLRPLKLVLLVLGLCLFQPAAANEQIRGESETSLTNMSTGVESLAPPESPTYVETAARPKAIARAVVAHTADDSAGLLEVGLDDSPTTGTAGSGPLGESLRRIAGLRLPDALHLDQISTAIYFPARPRCRWRCAAARTSRSGDLAWLAFKPISASAPPSAWATAGGCTASLDSPGRRPPSLEDSVRWQECCPISIATMEFRPAKR